MSSLNSNHPVRVLLESIPLNAMREAVRKNRALSLVYRGFRPQNLTKSVLLIKVPVFVRDPSSLEALAQVLLDTKDMPPDPNFSRRLTQAVVLNKLDEAEQQACTELFAIPTQQDEDRSPAPVPDVILDVDLPSEASESAEGVAPAPPLADTHVPHPFILERTMLDWNPPIDDVHEAHEAVTLFERALMEFVARQLQALHGEAWLRRGCGQYRKGWSAKANGASVEPRTLLGYAEIGDLCHIMLSRQNWPAFSAYFSSKDSLNYQFAELIELRKAAAHAGQREIRLLDQVSPLFAMVKIAESFHTDTASRIDEIYRNTLLPDREGPSGTDVVEGMILTNLSEFSPEDVIGREDLLNKIGSFWSDPFKRVLSIVGAGGVGKTSLLDVFTKRLLEKPYSPGSRPDPEVIVYLTAKDNYLEFMRRPQKSRQFQTLRRIYEVTLGMMGENPPPDADLGVLRTQVLSLAQETRVFFALDNLESVSDPELDQIGAFLDDLPNKSKAIVTSRENRRIGHVLNVPGLAPVAARDLFLNKIEAQGLDRASIEESELDELLSYTHGFPLAIVAAANAMTSGRTARETLEHVRGAGFIELLEFSYERSFTRLDTDETIVLTYLALSKTPVTRKSMLTFAIDDERLDDMIRNLTDLSLIRRTAEERKQIHFVINNNMLRDYTLKRTKEVLAPKDHASAARAANVLPAQSGSPSVAIEIDRAIDRARQAAREDWNVGIRELESARQTWGEEPRLIAQLGYYYFRIQDRAQARVLLEKAITLGLESAECHAHLGLVYLYERDINLALTQAERALSLNQHYPMAHTISAQCLVAQARRDKFAISADDQIRRLEQAREHMERSVASQTEPYSQGSGDERRVAILREIDELLGGYSY